MTVILRRIDHLGRIVIPKEVRDDLRIRDGDKLEVISSDGKIIIKKQGNNAEIIRASQSIIDFIQKFINDKIIITDRDSIIAVTQNVDKKYLNNKISAVLSKKIEFREINQNVEVLSLTDDQEEVSVYIEQVIKNGYLEGLVIILTENLVEEQQKNTRYIAKLLSNLL